jgi:hypothetical protein
MSWNTLTKNVLFFHCFSLIISQNLPIYPYLHIAERDNFVHGWKDYWHHTDISYVRVGVVFYCYGVNFCPKRFVYDVYTMMRRK